MYIKRGEYRLIDSYIHVCLCHITSHITLHCMYCDDTFVINKDDGKLHKMATFVKSYYIYYPFNNSLFSKQFTKKVTICQERYYHCDYLVVEFCYVPSSFGTTKLPIPFYFHCCLIPLWGPGNRYIFVCTLYFPHGQLSVDDIFDVYRYWLSLSYKKSLLDLLLYYIKIYLMQFLILSVVVVLMKHTH